MVIDSWGGWENALLTVWYAAYLIYTIPIALIGYLLLSKLFSKLKPYKRWLIADTTATLLFIIPYLESPVDVLRHILPLYLIVILLPLGYSKIMHKR